MVFKKILYGSGGVFFLHGDEQAQTDQGIERAVGAWPTRHVTPKKQSRNIYAD